MTTRPQLLMREREEGHVEFWLVGATAKSTDSHKTGIQSPVNINGAHNPIVPLQG